MDRWLPALLVAACSARPGAVASRAPVAVDAGGGVAEAELEPLPALPVPDPSSTPPPTPAPLACPVREDWDGTGCASTVCGDDSRFVYGRGCESCATFGCGRDTLVRPPDSMTSPFDRGGSGAVTGVELSGCSRPGGPTGAGHVTLTFAPAGTVDKVRLDAGPFAGTPTGACIIAQFERVTVPRFRGTPVRVGRSFVIR